jgi:hypothetical protein
VKKVVDQGCNSCLAYLLAYPFGRHASGQHYGGNDEE